METYNREKTMTKKTDGSKARPRMRRTTSLSFIHYPFFSVLLFSSLFSPSLFCFCLLSFISLHFFFLSLLLFLFLTLSLSHSLSIPLHTQIYLYIYTPISTLHEPLYYILNTLTHIPCAYHTHATSGGIHSRG